MRYRGEVILAMAAGGVAMVPLLVVPASPGYDAWSWLVWGRELTSLELSTTAGPAFKPLPVGMGALLAPLGRSVPTIWVWVALTAALIAVVLAFRLARELAGGSWLAGAAAGVGVAFGGPYLALAASGGSEGLLLAAALLGVLAVRRGRPRVALACATACGLLRVETWPFLLVAAALAWRRRSIDRRLLAALVVTIPALWFGPDWLGSGDPLRSAERARLPNPGQPALAERPALASLREAAGLLVLPVALGLGALPLIRSIRRPAIALAAAGAAWLVLVAVMSQLGFSGEGRYSLLGVGLLAIAGGVGLADVAHNVGTPGGRRLAVTSIATLLGAAALLRAAELRADGAVLAHRARLSVDLAAAVEAVGGADAVLRCGRPYVGRFRGPLLAWHLDAAKHRVGFDPRAPGVVFRSRLEPGEPLTPARQVGFSDITGVGAWEVSVACGDRGSTRGSVGLR